ncbi:MFS transporter [Actinomyces faecalis]|uniref:MFS transporter n=1 Tax=Actinomyces faecalis TaxID=2722820 RepID=UPI001552AC23|nr:MFS transporter [Actinomyces faecalis]
MTTPTHEDSSHDAERGHAVRRAATASFIGNFIEWFDYASYGYLAVIIGEVFFPSTSPTAQLLSAFAVFAISFILRPCGAIIWGAWGDSKGRRWALSWSILIMSGSTFAVGCIPGYEVLGIGSVILLLLARMGQGFSASGEYAGAATFLAEYSPRRRRGIYVSLVPASTATGLLVGSLFVSLLYTTLDDAAMHSWGWRIPFLLAGPLGLIGRYIRLHLEDSPTYTTMRQQLEHKGEAATAAPRRRRWSEPLKELMIRHRPALLTGFGVSCLNAVAFYMLLSYMPSYATTELGLPSTQATLATSVCLTVYILVIPFIGHVSDCFGRKRIMMVACLAFTVLTIPLFHLMSEASLLLLIICEIIFALVLSLNDGTLASFLAELFPTQVRYSGFALSFNTANTLLGGTTPLISTWLISVTGSGLAPSYFLTAIAVIAFLTLITSHARVRSNLVS